MVGIRDNAKRVDYLGFKVRHTKAIVFVISGTFAGIAGSVYALFQNVVSADAAFHILNSFIPVMAAFIGGLGSFYGPIYGSAILALLEQFTTRYTERVELVTGLLFILAVMYAPMGFAGILETVKSKWFRKPVTRPTTESAS
jgi:branched-chain amino acid transport system permease protein